MANITKALVEAVRIPQHGQIFIRDDQLKGFALRVTDTGVKSFIWEGRIKGRVRRITLGQFPALTVLDARKTALETKTAVAHGEDPAQDRAEIRAERTFGDLADAYLERHAKQRKRSWREDDAVLKNHLPSGWRNRRLSDITREEVIQLRDTVARKENPRVKNKEERKKGMPYAANHLVRLLRTMFNLARDWGMLVGDNPATRIKLLSETKRDRFLSPDELARVNSALAQEPNEYWRAYFALSLMLGTRKGELLVVKWSDIDFRQKTLRISQTKAGRPHILPLPAPAISTLESLPSREISEWVFPSIDSKTGHLASPKHAWERIRKAARVPDVRVHDLRRTLGSWLAASGYSLPLIGRALNHTQVSTTAIYARMNLDPVREALEHNAAMMLSAGLTQGANGHAPKPSMKDRKSPSPLAEITSPQTEPRRWVELSRQELYEYIWSRPALSLAHEFGISDRGLGKICERFEIPVPSRGYWQKLSAGQRLERTPLPRLKTKLPSKIQIRRTPTDTDAPTPDRPQAERQALSEKGSASSS
jgi:integrase